MTADSSAGRRRSWIDVLFGVDRFGVLLILLVVSFLLPDARERYWPQLVYVAINLAAFAAGLSATGLWRYHRVTAAIALASLTSIVLLASNPRDSVAAGSGAILQALVQFVVLGAVVGRILRHDRVNQQTILGSLAAYFLIGLFFAWIYLAIGGFHDGPILEPPTDELPSYYSFVVLTTLGFGDVSPVNELAQKVTAIEAMIGQMFLATLVARLVSMYGGTRSHRDKGDASR